MTMIKTLLKKLISLLLTTSLVLLLAVAVYVSLGRQLLPYVVNYRADIEAQLSASIGQYVQVGSLQGDWRRFNPIISLQQVLIFPAGSAESAQVMLFDNLSLELDVWSSLLARRWVLANIEVIGPEFTLAEQEDGGWQLRGFETGTEAPMNPDQILDLASRVNNLVLSNMSMTLQRHDGRSTRLERGRLRLQSRDQQYYLHLDAWQTDVVGPLSVAAELSGSSAAEISGLLYLLLPGNDYSELVAGRYAEALDLDAFDGSGEFWVEIDQGQVQAVQGSAAINSVALGLVENDAVVALDNLEARFFARRTITGSGNESDKAPSWEILLQDLSFQWNDMTWRESDLYVNYQAQQTLQLRADSFNLGIATGILASVEILNAEGSAQLAEHNPRGEMQNLEVWLSLQDPGAVETLHDEKETFRLSANLSDVAFSARGAAPALWGVDGFAEVSFDATAQTLTGSVEVDSSRFMIQLPTLFNDAWAYDHVNGRVRFSLDISQGQHLRLASSVIVAESDAVNGRAMFSTEYRRTTDENRTSTLELMVGALTADVSQKSLYLPTAPRVSDSLRGVMNWVDGAVLGGRAVESGVIFRGSLLAGSAPEDKTLQMYYNVQDGTLRFDPQWPVLENLHGNVIIKDREVDIRVESGQSLGMEFDATNAAIRPNPGGGSWLSVAGRGNGAAQQGLRYLQETPVTRGFGDYMADWVAQGSVSLNLDLSIPLGIPDIQPRVDVGLALHDNSLSIPEFELHFTQLGGDLSYSTQSGLSGEQMSATLFDKPVAVNIRSEVDAQRTTNTFVELAGSADTQALRDWPLQSAFVQGLLRRAEGEMNYQARLDLAQPSAAQQDGVAARRSLTITSSLQGVALDYPAPLRKETHEELALDLRIAFLGDQQDLRVALGDVGSVNVRLERGAVRNGLVFLGRRAEGVTVRRLNANAPGLDVVGSLPFFSYDDWMSALRSDPDAVAPSSASDTNFSQLREAINAVDITIGEAHVFGQTFDDLNVQIASEDRDWVLTLASEKVGGVVRVPYAADVPLNVHLTHLHFPAPLEPEVAEDDVSVVEGAVAPDSVAASPSTPDDVEEERMDPLLDFDPRNLPSMRFTADQILRGDADYGRWQFMLEPITNGAQFTDLIVEARGLRAGREGEEARFVWNYDGTTHHSYLTAALEANNIATVLSGFGYAPSLESTTAKFNATLDWPGSPAFFASTGLSGELDMNIMEGRFQQGATGAGSGALKLISIINFDALVRRLRFSDDLVRSGLSFEQITGAMTLRNGIVTIRDRLQIIGPASLFQVTGQLDLPQQTIDGNLYITLPISDNIPWLSGIAILNNLINWQLAVGVFLFDQIFGDQVDSLTSAQYTLQGPWEGLEPRLSQVFGNPSAPATTTTAPIPPTPIPPANQANQ
ncbi:MAG: YhdP family protein [Gammaproteobacteria bacterium]|nr:YhdP family protein [Gammaproteobacteria bacterium]MDP2347907.1 YhdP family protein [Gammaproteobacteria bacterium]